ncbi:MAG: S8 family serine peptidase [Proteobacteria bacterium]|nr:S8 family serine peptidase [Pseudomonadota bacterium]
MRMSLKFKAVGPITRGLALTGATLLLSNQAFSSGYIVKVKGDKTAYKAFLSRKATFGGTVEQTHAAGNLVLVDFGKTDTSVKAERIANLLADPMVQYVVENKKVHAFGTTNDPDLSKQWSMEKIRAAEAWTSGVGNRKIVVAITDTGIDYTHTDIAENMWHNPKEIPGNGKDDDGNGFVDDVFGYDFNQNDGDPRDETGPKNPGHGTHCAGIMGGVGNNGRGITGMSQQLSMMAVRFLGADGSGDLMGAAKAIDYAVANGANIISASWGANMGASDAQPVTDAISRANDKGVIFVVAAANDGKNNDTTDVYPANTNLPNIISVAASGSTDAKPTWSNYGFQKVHVSAPGENIWSTLAGDKFGSLSGTSMATPLVSGLVALMLSHNDKLTAPQVKAMLQSTGAQVAIETACECRVDAAAAVERVMTNALTVIPQAATINTSNTLQFSATGGKTGYTYASSAESIASIDQNGLLTAKTTGEVNVTVTDSSGANNTSLRIRITEPGSGGGGGGGGGGGDMECPLDPQLCEAICAIMPDLPWCKTSNL